MSEHVGGSADDAMHRARQLGYGAGEFVDQQGFMLARDIRALAERAGIGPATRVLDLCCGEGGPGRLITRELDCDYLGVDASAGAVAAASERVGDLACRYETRQVPPLPSGPFDVVLLLETMLAFPDKDRLLREVRSVLDVGGRFACTVEEGAPLTPAEQVAMPAADTVWPVRLPALVDSLERAGLEVTWQEECSREHLAVVDALLAAFAAHEEGIERQIGRSALAQLVTAHRLWSTWLGSGRIRAFALVAQAAQPVQREESAYRSSATSPMLRVSTSRARRSPLHG